MPRLGLSDRSTLGIDEGRWPPDAGVGTIMVSFDDIQKDGGGLASDHRNGACLDRDAYRGYCRLIA